MRLLNVNCSGMFSYGQVDTINLDDCGLVLLEGRNGHGKTSIFHAITSILYDETAVGESGEAIVNKVWNKGAFGKIEFLDRVNNKWRVIYTRRWKSHTLPIKEVTTEPSEWLLSGAKYSGTDIFLERWDESKWIDERTTNLPGEPRLDNKSTRKKIIDLLEVDYDRFLSAAYLAQQKTLNFISGKHKERLDILTELSSINVWDKRVRAIRDNINETESETHRIQSLLDGMLKTGDMIQEPSDSEKKTLENVLINLTIQVEDCDQRITASKQNRQTWLDARTKLEEASKSVLEQVKALAIKRDSIQRDITQCVKDYSDICSKVRGQPRDPLIDKTEEDLRQLRCLVQIKRQDYEQLLPDGGRCPRCKTVVSYDHIARHKELLTVELTELEAQIREKDTELLGMVRIWTESLVQLLYKEEDKFKTKKTQLDNSLLELDQYVDRLGLAIELIKRQLVDLGADPKHSTDVCVQERLFLVERLEGIKRQLGEWDTKKKQWDQYQSAIKDCNKLIRDYDTQLKHLKIVDRLMGNRGIKAHKIGIVLSMLNFYLKEFIETLTDDMQVWVTPFREKSDGETTTDMQIMIREGQKEGVPFNLYSGGEKQLITLAFIGAFWRLAESQGTGTNILCLDEIFGPFDEFNTGKVLEFLDLLKSSGKSTIIVVTHNQKIKDELDFTQVWEVKKKNHISNIEVNICPLN